MIMRSAPFLMLLLALPGGAQEATFEREGWPGEGMPVLLASNSELELHEAPDLRSAVTELAYGKEQRILFASSLVRTLKEVDLKTIGAGTLEVWCEGDKSELLTLESGQSWTYLQYGSEGFVVARVQGKVCDLPALMEQAIFGTELPNPEVQWWVQVKLANGSLPGWLLVTDSQVRFGQREF